MWRSEVILLGRVSRLLSAQLRHTEPNPLSSASERAENTGIRRGGRRQRSQGEKRHGPRPRGRSGADHLAARSGRLAVASSACGEANRRRLANIGWRHRMDCGDRSAGQGEAGRVGLPSAGVGRLQPPFLFVATPVS
jgi:hypothetical protein